MGARGSEHGAGLGEVLILTAAAAVAVAAATAQLLPGAASPETVRGATQSLYTYVQLARVEAVARDRPCRLVVDPRDARVRVLDSLGTADEADDLLLHETVLAASIAEPGTDPASVRGQARMAGSAVRVDFRPDGNVAPSAITLFDGARFGRVSIDESAALHVESWDGSGWTDLR